MFLLSNTPGVTPKFTSRSQMEYFNLSKKFDRMYVGRGKTDGSVKSKDCNLMEQFQRRERKGRDYVKTCGNIENEEMGELDEIVKVSHGTTASVNDLECTTAGAAACIGELNTEKVDYIYKEYYKNNSKPKSNLIIHEYKKKILSLVETNEVTILTGPTGCGKTTQVPQFILDSNIEKNTYCNIVVTQPRRIAAISIAKRVCEERNWELGKLCGYKVGLKNCTSSDTLLTYMTIDVLLQTLIRKKNTHSYTHIVLDEIHERNQSMDFALVIIKKLLNTASQNVKVILMSATVEAMKFANYFQKLCVGGLQSAPVLTINHSTNYNVQIHYLEELAALGELPEIMDTDPQISTLNFDICIRLIKQFEKIDNEENKKNSVLVFLPGLFEIEYLYTKLTDPKIHSGRAVPYKWVVLPLHSTITTEEQAQVFLSPPNGYRKIILSTNIAESSITVPGIKFVIDFCLTKYLKMDSSNFSSLQLCWASQANCIQRAGRVGRVMEGRVYRMVYKDFYDSLEKEAKPEMLTAPLEKVVLQSKILNMGEPKAILAMALDPPDLTNIESTILALKEVGGLLRTRKGISVPLDGDLTFLGRLMAVLPVDMHITRLIVMGYLFSCLEECIIMGACMSLKSIFNYPFKTRLKAYNSKLDWADGSCSDCIAFLNVYEIWCSNQKSGYFKRSAGDNEAKWAKRHFVQLRVLKEVKLLVEELKMRLKENLIEEPVGAGKVQWNEFQKALVLKVAIGGAFYPNYFGRGLQGGRVSEEYSVRVVGGRNPFTTVYFNNFPADQPLALYSELIKSELSECNEDMKITSDCSSKVYVEFRKTDLTSQNEEDMPFNGTLPGKIPMGVYRAVKIRHIKRSINIKVLPVEEAQKRAASLGIKNRFECFEQEDEADKSQLISVSIPAMDVSCIHLVITHIVDPGNFWAFDVSHSEQQRMIFHSLNDNHGELLKFDKTPSVGEICIAPFEENGETCLYRARVMSIKNKTVKVFFIDYGNISVVLEEDLRRYSPKLAKLLQDIPGQAFECVLCEIRPRLIMNPKGNWSEESRVAFDRLTQDSRLFGSIYSVVNGVVSLELFTCNGRSEQISINQYLIYNGYAEKTDENYLSKMDHEMRKQRDLDSDGSKLYKQKHHGFWDGDSIAPPEMKDCTINVQLRGPHSPLEMKIYPYVRSALNKCVRINDESVNSVLLDTDPQDVHERLIVAGSVNQNLEGSLLSLNNTTVMPNVHGLAAIIPFIFAPEIELRVDSERTRYTGMLCGLGSDENGVAIFPEHDFEVCFDCEITFEDFAAVNRLRYFMSLLLLTEGDEQFPNLSYPDIIELQKKIKSTLLSILTKQRKSMEMEQTRFQHKWKLIESDIVVDNPIANRYNELSIFRFHQGVSLSEHNFPSSPSVQRSPDTATFRNIVFPEKWSHPPLCCYERVML